MKNSEKSQSQVLQKRNQYLQFLDDGKEEEERYDEINYSDECNSITENDF